MVHSRPGFAKHAGAALATMLLASFGATGCAGHQSALDPAGTSAQRLADLFWLLTAGVAAVWVGSVALWWWGVSTSRRPLDDRSAGRLLLWGGGIAPTVLLGGLLSWSLAMLPDIVAPAPPGSLRIEVTGYQWWWRVRYLPSGGDAVESANEIRLPVGQPVQLELESRDVIHSIWIPAIGGKMDMIPGRRTSLALEATRPGVYRGACAEYCGASHALMAMAAVALDSLEFQQWLAAEAAPAALPESDLERRGASVFLESGCGACHSVRGTDAAGVIGPDLTHVGSRVTVGAGLLATSPESLRHFIAETEEVKPGVHMPAFGMLPEGDLDALAAYLASLR